MAESDAPLSEFQPAEESRRLAVLDRLRILDTPPEDEFDTIVECARRLIGTEIALFSLVTGSRQWFKAKSGLDASETPRDQAFCAHAIQGNDVFVIPDATLDARFADNPLVTGAPDIRFYAGVPVHAAEGTGGERSHAMGTVCVIDSMPRALSEEEADILRRLGRLAESLLSARAMAAQAQRIAEDRRIALQNLEIIHRQFRQAERMANIGSWRLALDDNSVEWSDQVYAIHGLPNGVRPELDEALDFYPPSDRADVAGALAQAIETGSPFNIEADFITAQGAKRRIHTMGEVEVRGGVPHAVIGVLQDITIRHRLEQQLRRSATCDDLTGLANRAHFNVVADAAITTARRRGDALAVALLDLDRFKAVNDGHGHQAGDEVLRLMAARLGADYLAGTFAARLGGDEFVLVITDQDALANLPALLARLSADLSRLAVFDDGQLVVSATIGAAWLDADTPDRSALLHCADTALYDAKRERRGSVRVCKRSPIAPAKRRGAG